MLARHWQQLRLMQVQLQIQTEMWTMPEEAVEYLLPGQEKIPVSCLKFPDFKCEVERFGQWFSLYSRFYRNPQFEVGVVQSAWESHANYMVVQVCKCRQRECKCIPRKLICWLKQDA
jgi:hypothetical protein